MRRIGWKRGLIGLGAIAAFAGLYLFWFDRPVPIQFYRLLDDRTVAVDVDDGSAWNRIDRVVETETTVTISVRSLIVPTLPAQAGLARTVELTVKLDRPLGSRTVIDGYSLGTLGDSCRPWLSGCPTMPPMPTDGT